MVKTHLYQINTRISQVWQCTPVVPATWEAEVGGLLEPRRQRLQGAKVMTVHFSLSDKLSQKKTVSLKHFSGILGVRIWN